MRIALICIPALMLSGCGILPKAEPVAYQAPAAVAKPAPVAKKAVAPRKAAVAPKRKPNATPSPSSDGGDKGSPWG